MTLSEWLSQALTKVRRSLLPGTPPVLSHAIDDDPIEIEDQQGSIIHGQKLGR